MFDLEHENFIMDIDLPKFLVIVLIGIVVGDF